MTGPPAKSVVVTGASGFLAGHIAAYLKQRGIRVRAVARTPRPDGLLADDWVHVERYHEDDAAFASAFRDVDAVVNLAGRAHILRENVADPMSAFRNANVAAARSALVLAKRHDVRRFVQMSSIAAVCSSSDAFVDDSTVPRPTTPYGISKLEADTVLANDSAGSNVGVTSLRPPLIVGPQMGGNPLMLFKFVAGGYPLPLGGLHNRRSMVYVENLAAAVASSLTVPTQPVGTYALSDSDPISTTEFIELIAEALGIPANLVSAPSWAVSSAAAVLRALPAWAPTPVTAEQIERSTSSLPIDSRRFWNAVGAKPAIAFSDGVRRTAQWFRETAASRD